MKNGLLELKKTWPIIGGTVKLGRGDFSDTYQFEGVKEEFGTEVLEFKSLVNKKIWKIAVKAIEKDETGLYKFHVAETPIQIEETKTEKKPRIVARKKPVYSGTRTA